MDWLTDALVSLASSIIDLFPDSPFLLLQDFISSDIAPWLPFVNWFIPLGAIVSTLEAWLACIGIYYVYQIILRWIKVIE